VARRTRRELEQRIEFFYGINPQTFEIESVSLTRGGMLHKMGKNLSHESHAVIGHRSPKTEIIIVWGLLDLFSVPASLDNGEFAKAQLEDLKQKAVERKQASETAKASGII